MPTKEERETCINFSDVDRVWRFNTSRPSDIALLRKHRAVEVRSGAFNDGGVWAEFELPAEKYSLKGFKRVLNLTAEQRQALGDRMREVRKA